VKKKDLFEQNTVLYNRLQTVSAELQKYKQLYSQNLEIINSLNHQIEELNSRLSEKETAEEEIFEQIIVNDTSEEVSAPATPVVLDVELETATEYGAQIIGKIVLEGTKVNNSVAETNSNLSVDIINLILGKTEVCKSKIYDICHSNLDDDRKKTLIDEIYTECLDYFKSLNYQI